jgi:hypothetical protein
MDLLRLRYATTLEFCRRQSSLVARNVLLAPNALNNTDVAGITGSRIIRQLA